MKLPCRFLHQDMRGACAASTRLCRRMLARRRGEHAALSATEFTRLDTQRCGPHLGTIR